MFLRFAKFYKRFIQRFNWKATPLILLLKTSSTKSAKPKKGGVEVVGDSSARYNGMNNVEVDGGEVRNDEVGKKGQKTSKSKNLSKSKKTVKSDFLIPKARLMFIELRQAFIKAPIFHHFDPEYHIQIKTNVLGYSINRVLSQLTSDDLDQWHPIAFFSYKIIPVETRYKTHDGKFLAIVKAFKIWRHYLEDS